jgi:phosphoinositide-3-kinase regulatory subunit 4
MCKVRPKRFYKIDPSWNWILLCDFASFKPTFLPEDNPADFSYFFDTSRCFSFRARFLVLK